MTFCPRRIVSTIGSVNNGFCPRVVLFIGMLSTWVFVYFDSDHSEVGPHDNRLTKDGVHSWFCQIWILLNFGSVYFGVCPPGCFSTLILRTCVSGHMTFCPRRIVQYWFCLRVVLSTWETVHLVVGLLGYSGYMTFCPFRIVSSIGSVNSGFCSRLLLSIWKSVYLGVCLLGFCPLGNLGT